MCALGKLQENSYLKKEIWTKKSLQRRWGGEHEKENK